MNLYLHLARFRERGIRNRTISLRARLHCLSMENRSSRLVEGDVVEVVVEGGS